MNKLWVGEPPIDALRLPNRTTDALIKADVATVRELKLLIKNNLLRHIKGIGAEAVRHIEWALKAYQVEVFECMECGFIARKFRTKCSSCGSTFSNLKKNV